MPNIKLDSRLLADSNEIGCFDLCQIRLMNDARWPWLILVPDIVGAIELHELDENHRHVIARETSNTAIALKNLTGCEKINTAAIGNIVRQLHIHVIARNSDDANWPGPVWGFGTPEPYDEKFKTMFSIKLREEFRLFDEFTDKISRT